MRSFITSLTQLMIISFLYSTSVSAIKDIDKPSASVEDEQKDPKDDRRDELLSDTNPHNEDVSSSIITDKAGEIEAAKPTQSSALYKRISQLREYNIKRDEEPQFHTQDLGIRFTKNRSQNPNAKDIIQIIKEYHNASVLFDKDGEFTGTVAPLLNGGSSTSFLYRVDQHTGQPVFIVKGINNSNEVGRLGKLRRSNVLSNLPMKDPFPILTWPEGIYRYTAGSEHHPKDRYVSVLNVARGNSLDFIFNKKKPEEATRAFFAVGQSIAAFNLHCAGFNKGRVTLGTLAEVLPFSHEDLHWENIFIHEKPFPKKEATAAKSEKRYRVYLIDNETMGRSDEKSHYYNDRSDSREALSGQLFHLYGLPVFSWEYINRANPEDLARFIYEGFIKGYASQFSDPKYVESYLLHRLTQQHYLFSQVCKHVETGATLPSGETKAEKALIKSMLALAEFDTREITKKKSDQVLAHFIRYKTQLESQ